MKMVLKLVTTFIVVKRQLISAILASLKMRLLPEVIVPVFLEFKFKLGGFYFYWKKYIHFTNL